MAINNLENAATTNFTKENAETHKNLNINEDFIEAKNKEELYNRLKINKDVKQLKNEEATQKFVQSVKTTNSTSKNIDNENLNDNDIEEDLDEDIIFDDNESYQENKKDFFELYKMYKKGKIEKKYLLPSEMLMIILMMREENNIKSTKY